MAFEVPADRTVPDATTVAGFTLQRLGAPVLRVQYAETRAGWLPVEVSEKIDATTLIINEFMSDPASAIGLEWLLPDGTVVGTISDYVVIPEVLATEADPAIPAKGQATITGTGLT